MCRAVLHVFCWSTLFLLTSSYSPNASLSYSLFPIPLKIIYIYFQVEKRLLDFNFYAEVIGMFERNNWGMCATNPLTSYQSLIEAKAEDGDVAAKAVMASSWWPEVEALAEHCAEGTGLYIVGSTFNHSCDPNVVLLKPQGDFSDRTAVLALRDIAAGEELCISYIDEDASLEDRNEMLRDYGFTCSCTKCQAESA